MWERCPRLTPQFSKFPTVLRQHAIAVHQFAAVKQLLALDVTLAVQPVATADVTQVVIQLDADFLVALVAA